jgi:hypothetical protein
MLLSHTETESGLGNADRRHLVDRHPLAVGLDLHWFEQACARPAGAQSAQFVLQGRMGGLHAAFEFGKVELRQLRHVRPMNSRPNPAARVKRAAQGRVGCDIPRPTPY